MGKKGKIIGAIAAAAGAIAGALWLKKKKNRDKVKETFSKAKNRTVSATKKAAKQAKEPFDLTKITGIGPARAKKLRKAGIVTLKQVQSTSAQKLADHAGVSKEMAISWQNAAKGMK